MEKRPLTFQVDGNVPENITIEVIEREGKASVIDEPKSYSFSGVITAPKEWIKGIKYPSPEYSIVEYSIEGKCIKLIEDKNQSIQNVIEGRLIENSELDDFHINEDRFFTNKELVAIVMKRGYMFGADKAKKLIKQLKNFAVKFEQEIEKTDDSRGNKKDNFSQAMKFTKGEIAESWTISAPLYKGIPEENILLEIEIDKNPQNQPVFAFYSLDFESIMKSRAKEIIEAEIKEISEASYLCLEKC